MNWLKRWRGHKVRSTSLLERTPTDAEVVSACYYAHHGFGLLTPDQRKAMAFEAREWLHAWRKVQEDTRSNKEVRRER